MAHSLLDFTSYLPADGERLLRRAHALAEGTVSARLLERRLGVSIYQPDQNLTAAVYDATRMMGVTTVALEPSEGLNDLALAAQGSDLQALLVSHPAPGSAALLARRLSMPVINGGDGAHAHPVLALALATQATRSLGTLEGRKVAVVGDIRHSGLARSLAQLLGLAGASTVLCGPPALLPLELNDGESRVTCEPILARAVTAADVIIQLPRPVSQPHEIPMPREYGQFYEGADSAALRIGADRPDPLALLSAVTASLEYALE